MTPDELRALADALDPSGKVLTHPGESALQRAAAHLRAQADAQPVAWLRPENRVEEECTARTRISIGERCPPIGTWRPLYTHPAPAAPQAKPRREPLTARRILEINDDASRQWRDNGRIIEYAVVFARMIERAHGIGRQR